MKTTTLLLLILSFFILEVKAQQLPTPSKQDTLKGSITPERAWWDVKYYELSVKPDFTHKTLTGKNIISYEVLKTNNLVAMQIDLQAPLTIDSAIYKNQKLSFKKDGNVYFLAMPPQQKGAINKVAIYYSGKPKESTNPPWDGGISWTKDTIGRPWITLGCQLIGASVWYPCKVYQGDEPDNGASIAITAPNSLVAVGNGKLMAKLKNQDQTTTYKWNVVSPINNYGIAFYIGSYVHIPKVYEGEYGPLTTDYWVIDYNKNKVDAYLKIEVNKTLKTFEHWFGPYPFYKDGFKMVEAPYPGMEHQSAIAYGNDFKFGRVKFKNLSYWDLKTDRLVVHEMAHEWFGNNITTKDFTDQWVHEGFAGLAEELFIEDQYGKKAAKEFFVARTTGRITNKEPIIKRYGIFEEAGEDMYLKGWALLHMIRRIVANDDQFRKMLHGLNKEFYHKTINSEEIEKFITQSTKINLKPVFDQYLRKSEIPVLEYNFKNGNFSYRFTNVIKGFVMPIQIHLTADKWITATTDWKNLNIGGIKDSLTIDPDFYIQVKKVE